MNELQAEAIHLLNLLKDVKTQLEPQGNTKGILQLDKNIICRSIIPFLDIKDLINFRSTCMDINESINSPMTIISFLKQQNKKLTQPSTATSSIELKSFKDINDIEDVQEQLLNLKNINEFLAKRIFKSEAFIKVCKTDIEFLKKQLDSQQQLTSTLTENLNSARSELEKLKYENSILSTNCDEANRKLNEATKNLKQENETLLLNNDKLTYDIEMLQLQIYKLNKQKEELTLKNSEKAKALKSIRDYFLSSNIFKIKTISEYEQEYENRINKD